MYKVDLTSVLAVCLLSHVVVAGKQQLLRLRGVPLSKSSLYSPNKDFQCLDGSQVLSFLKVNDDYCDCQDGSDEPGTAACTNGSFFCQNTGHQAMYIPSSWVNDGICDCCDTSDEYASDIQCVDNCHDLGREAWLKAQQAAELAKEGNKIRLEYISQGKQLKSENQAKLAKLRADHEEAELTKKEREQIKKRAEEREAAALEKYKPAPTEQKEEGVGGGEEEEEFEAEEYFRILDSDSSGTVSVAELQSRATFDKDRNGEITREEALYFLNNFEELTMQEFIDTAWSNIKPFVMLEKGIFKPGDNTEEGEDHHDSEGEADAEEYEHPHDAEDEQQLETQPEEGRAHVEEVQETTEPPAPVYDEETQALIDEAREARERYQEAENSVLDLLSQIRSLEEKNERDYGLEEEFYVLDGQCFEYSDLEYVYSLCPFGRATQRSKSGGSEVNLGQWNEWIGEGDAKYTKAKFDRGLTCWNGPSRSTIVHLTCGMENKLLSVSEPNRCEYTMEMSTPALCNPNLEKQDTHDEL